MAKTKKKEKVVELKSEKVTEDQLKRIKETVERINNTTMSLGQLSARKHQALHYLAGVNDELILLQNELKDRIKKTGYYGHGTKLEENLDVGFGLFNQLKRKKNAMGGMIDEPLTGNSRYI